MREISFLAEKINLPTLTWVSFCDSFIDSSIYYIDGTTLIVTGKEGPVTESRQEHVLIDKNNLTLSALPICQVLSSIRNHRRNPLK